MPRRPLVKCPSPGCTEMTPKGVKCNRCKSLQRNSLNRMRGNSRRMGYSSADGWPAARREALERDRVCLCEADYCDHQPGRCGSAATVADHHPLSRRELLAAGVAFPNDPQYLRGLCPSCHSKSTARNQPGGWNRR